MSWTRFLREAASLETDRVKAQLRTAVRSVVLTVVAGLLLLVGIVFVLTGAYVSLSEQMPAWQAGGAVGLGMLAVCLLLLAGARRGGRGGGRSGSRSARSTDHARPSAEDLEAAADLGAAASDAAHEFVRDHRPSGLQLTLAAFVAGLVASRRSRRRDRD